MLKMNFNFYEFNPQNGQMKSNFFFLFSFFFSFVKVLFYLRHFK